MSPLWEVSGDEAHGGRVQREAGAPDRTGAAPRPQPPHGPVPGSRPRHESALEPAVAMAVGSIATPGPHQGGESLPGYAHHISGLGANRSEALIRCLAESLERYAHFEWPLVHSERILVESYGAMRSQCRVLCPENLLFFSEAQYLRDGFPFSRPGLETTVGWAPSQSLIHGNICWVPAQVMLAGYVRREGEPPIAAGVTSGTASHKTILDALRAALLELIQVDAAMGNWYGSATPVHIRHDYRTRIVHNLIGRQLYSYGPAPQFYWLPNADLPGITIACVISDQRVPKWAVGLSCDLRLSRAVYRAFLEAVAVRNLAKAVLLRRAMGQVRDPIEPGRIYDLDSNIAYYATEDRSAFLAKFGCGTPSVSASDLPADIYLGVTGDVRHLIESFRETGKDLVLLDLTTTDIREIGFHIVRVWSPETLSLSLPSAPLSMSTRFAAYGGFTNEAPHPYP